MANNSVWRTGTEIVSLIQNISSFMTMSAIFGWAPFFGGTNYMDKNVPQDYFKYEIIFLQILFCVTCVWCWIQYHLSVALDNPNPIIAHDHAKIWIKSNCFWFIMEISASFQLLNPEFFAEIFPTGLITWAIVVVVHLIFIIIVGNFMVELNAAATTFSYDFFKDVNRAFGYETEKSKPLLESSTP